MIKLFVTIVCCLEISGFIITFLKEPQSLIVPPKSHLQLPCQAVTHITNAQIVTNWIHNGTWIIDYNRKHYKLLSNGSLSFDIILPSDQGVYQCSAMVLPAASSTFSNNNFRSLSRNATVRLAFMRNHLLDMPSSKQQEFGSEVNLQCISPESLPAAKVYWNKDDKLLTSQRNESKLIGSSTSTTLQIKNFSFADIGNYTCVARNTMLNKEVVGSPILLSVIPSQNQPYFVVQPSSSTAIEHRSAKLDCYVLGIPNPSISWFKDGKLVVLDRRRFLAKNGSLTLSYVSIKDNGSYSCRGENILGSVTSFPPAQLTVAYILFDFLINPLSQMVIIDRMFVLSCISPPSYPSSSEIHWYHNYTKIAPSERVYVAANHSLVVKHAVVKDAGKYFCLALNPLTKESRTSKPAVIKTYAYPWIHTPNTNMSVQTGESLIINCSATGRPLPHVSIYKRYRERNVLLTNSSFYIVLHANTQHQGLYICVAQNIAGHTQIEIIANVTSFPSILLSFRNTTVIWGSVLSLRCIYDGSPKPLLRWTFVNMSSSRLVLSNHTGVVVNSTSLQISNVTKQNEGWYSCAARNKVGEIVSKPGFVNVLVAPKIQTHSNDIVVNISNSFSLTCIATGNPVASIKWSGRFNFSTVVSNVDHKYGLFTVKSSLVVVKAWTGHEGEYKCEANNPVGSDERTFSVKVQVPPLITSFRISGKLEQNGTVVFDCFVHGTPPLHVSIEHRNTVMQLSVVHSGKAHIRVTVQRLSLKQNGNYVCFAQNMLGGVNVTKSIIIMVLPSHPIITDVQVLSPQSLQLKWTPGFNGHSPITAYVVNYTSWPLEHWLSLKVNSTSSSAILTGLLPNKLYRVKISAVNVLGQGGFSETISLKTWEKAPSRPTKLSVLSVSAIEIRLQWLKLANVHTYMIGLSSNSHRKTLIYNDTYVGQSLINTTVHELKPCTNYTIKIKAALLRKGVLLIWGNYSDAIVVATKQDIPGIVVDVIMTMVNHTTVKVSWSPLLQKNGIIKVYEVELTSDSKQIFTVRGGHTNLVLTSLQDNVTYYVRVRASTAVGFGNFTEQIRFRAGVLPTSPLTLTSRVARPAVSWLQREYMIVIIGTASLLLFILLLLIVVLATIALTGRKKVKGSAKENPRGNLYYGNANDSFVEGEANNLSVSTTREHQDLIWDDEINTVVVIPKLTVPDVEVNYGSVEPYQGTIVDSSPLVKLKGFTLNPNQRTIKPLAKRTSFRRINDDAVSINSLTDPPSLNNLDRIDAGLTWNEATRDFNANKWKLMEKEQFDIFDRLGDFELLEYDSLEI